MNPTSRFLVFIIQIAILMISARAPSPPTATAPASRPAIVYEPADAAAKVTYMDISRQISAFSPWSEAAATDINYKIKEFTSTLADADKKSPARLYQLLGQRFLYKLGRPSDAERAYLLSKELFTIAGCEHAAHCVFLEVGIVASTQSRLRDALQIFETTTAYFETANDPEFLASSLGNLANTLGDLQFGDRALEVYKRVEGLFRKLNKNVEAAQLIANVAATLQQLGRNDEALAQYEKARTAFSELNNKISPEKLGESLAIIYKNRGQVLSELGRYDEAIIEFKKAREGFAGAASAKREIAGLAFVESNALRRASRLAEAREKATEAEMLFREMNNIPGMSKSIATAAAVNCSMGDHAAAVELYKKARALASSETIETVKYKYSEADCLLHLSKPREAGALLDDPELRSKIIPHSVDGIHSLIIRARLESALSRDDAALDYMSRAALELETLLCTQIEKLGGESSLTLRARFLDIVEGSLYYYNRLADRSPKRLADLYRIVQVFHGRGVVARLADRGRIESTSIPREIKIQYAERLNLLKQQEARYASLLYRSPKDGTLQAAAEHAELLNQSKRLLSESAAELDSIIEELRILHPAFAAAVYPKAVDAREVQNSLAPGRMLIEYFISDSAAFAFVITGKSLQLIPVGPREPLLPEIQLSLDAPLDRAPNGGMIEFVGPWRALAKRILDPALAAVPPGESIDTIIISPDAELARVPFELLLTSDPPSNCAPAEMPFLIRKFNVAYVHSGGVLVEMARPDVESRPAPPSRPFFVGFGDPKSITANPTDASAAPRSRSELGRLPGSMLQIIDEARLFCDTNEERALLEKAKNPAAANINDPAASEVSGKYFTIFLRGAATEEALKTRPEIRRANVIDLACHGYGDPRSPSLSYLALAADSNSRAEDGFVHLNELRDLNIHADCILLSACETNIGKLRPFDGAEAFSLASLAAGAKSAICTMWKIPDSASRELTSSFFYHWISGSQGKAAALASAKRQLIQKGAAPREWAGFVIWDRGH